MAIFRGTGSASATADQTTIDTVTQAVVDAEAAQTAAEAAQTAAETAKTNAENLYGDLAAVSTAKTDAETAATTATTKASEASDDAADAQKLALNPVDSEFTLSDGSTTGYSALHYNTQTQLRYDNFDDRYLGAKSAEPSVDNDGDPLITGAMYFDTTDNLMYVWTGSGWVNVTPSSTVTISQVTDVTSNASELNILDVSAQTPSDGQVLTYNTVGDLNWATPTDLVGISNLVEDTTPQLGGDLDTNGNAITGTSVDINASNGDLMITATQDGPVALRYDGNLKLSTKSDGVNITGEIEADSLDIDGNGDITGNLTIGGTVDGRDVATDGTKLDGIASSATANPNAIDNVVEDTTPQLGGNLDLNSNNITGTGNINITGSVATDRATGTVTTDNDLSFDMNATNFFKCTPTGNGTLTFTNITAGQSGNIWLDNSGGHTISAAASTYIASADLTTISTAGVYFLSYYSDGTNVKVSATPAVTSAGA